MYDIFSNMYIYRRIPFNTYIIIYPNQRHWRCSSWIFYECKWILPLNGRCLGTQQTLYAVPMRRSQLQPLSMPSFLQPGKQNRRGDPREGQQLLTPEDIPYLFSRNKGRYWLTCRGGGNINTLTIIPSHI